MLNKNRLALFLFTVFFVVSYFLVLPAIFIFEQEYGLYHGVSYLDYLLTLWYSVPFIFCVYFGYFIFGRLLKGSDCNLLKKAVNTPRNLKFFFYFSIVPPLACLIFLLLTKGITIGHGGYGDQLEANAGNGVYLLFLYSYSPCALIYLLSGRLSNSRILITLSIMIIFGSLVFLITGGSRNIAAGGIVSLALYLLYFKRISLKVFGTFSITMMIGVTLLAFFRYSNSLSSSEASYLFFLYTLDSFSPINSLYQVIHKFEYSSDFVLVFFDNFFTQFYTFIPRAIWADKPILLMTNGKFITTEVLGLNGRFIVSPSVIGTAVVMLGYFYFFIGVFVGIVLRINDLFISSSSPLFKVIGFILLPSVFLLSRENLEFYIYKVIMISVTIFFVYLVFRLFIWMPSKVNKRRCS
ncbi:O-antigen polymerase [Vibrio sp. 1637]|uniref:O-antigen polymerase n=1 Tax=Vibrio sp. 1637 TaxID=3074569 RepID=UPI002964F47D|nr:O-antigen polymerase [Vibrio sp. 1637]MDW2175303.1 O-antigen polymerase [Vibrio sp. 1637]